ncbi:MAG: DUF2480 family protein [Ginsengibacter sp.]|jgi:hypothetical protein
MEDIIINKVAQSALITLDLEKYYPKEEIVEFDLKEYLFMELILKEKDFREAMKNIDWSIYLDKNIALYCSADAIVPIWAYMVVTTYLQPYAHDVIFGNKETALNALYRKNLSAIDPEDFKDKRIVIKGCADIKIPESAYVEITQKLRPVVKSIMYGEPCSTVPVYKKATVKSS